MPNTVKSTIVTDKTYCEKVENGVKYLQCNVTEESQIQDTISHITQTYGRLDVLVNSAGINKDSLLVKAQCHDIKSLLETNLVGTMLMCKWAVKVMLQQKSGSIVNIGSVIGQKGNRGQSIYSASKSGLIGFTKSLAKEVGSRGITVNAVAPGFIETQMTSHIKDQDLKKLCKTIPLQRFGVTKEVAEMVYFLVHSSYITGQVLYCDGGYHITM